MSFVITDYAASFVMQKHFAEIYERIYPYGAEDFVNHADYRIRNSNVDIFAKLVDTTFKQVSTYIRSHNHITASPGSPTSPPVMPLIIAPLQKPLAYTNTTGVTSNMANSITPFLYSSYLDLRKGSGTSINRPVTSFRRAKRLAINTPLKQPLTRQ